MDPLDGFVPFSSDQSQSKALDWLNVKLFKVAFVQSGLNPAFRTRIRFSSHL